MSLGQTMLTVAALVLLTVIVISANRLIIDTQKTSLEVEAADQAVEAAQSLMSEIQSKKFDHYAIDSVVLGTDKFTTYDRLGPEGAEALEALPDSVPYKSIDKFNDVDDYKGYSRLFDSPTIRGIRVSVSVYYISSGSPDVVSSSRTFFKRIDVTATESAYLKRNIKLSTIVTY